MATTTTGVNDATLVVTAYGQPAGGVWPHFRLLIDGVEAGAATVAAATANDYRFTVPVAALQGHHVQIQYDNDGSAGGQDRNLFVTALSVNGHALQPSQATYDRGALDGKDVIAGQSGMWWPGTLDFATAASNYPAPANAATSTIVVNALGHAAGGVNAHFNLLVDGVKVGEATAGTTAKDYSFAVNAVPGAAHTVQVQYDNDAVVNGQDRSLVVNTISVNGHAVKPTDAAVTYDKGALDGKDVVAGQSGMWWNGTLAVKAPASDFPASTTGTGGGTTITVNAHGNAAGGVNAHFTLLVDGHAVGAATVGATAKDYSFTTGLTADQAHKVQIQYDNDAVINGQDRALIVDKVTINGHAVTATDSAVTYDKGALDGKDVVKGQPGLWWNGTLVVDADKSWFPGGTGEPGNGDIGNGTSPAPTPTHDPVPLPTGPAIYVATNGNDSWSGLLSAPNAAGTDGPKATLTGARDALRAHSDIDTAYIRGGDYTMKDMLWLDQRDSGEHFVAYGSETPVFHGGTEVTNWVSRGGGLYSAQLSSGASPVLDLSMDGDRQVLARTPNADPSHPLDGGWLYATGSGGDASTQFTFKAGDIASTIGTSGLMATVFSQHGYDSVSVPVKSINFTTHTVTLAEGTYDDFGAGSRFYLYNGKDQLDAAHEWYYDAASKQILFKPAGGAVAGHEVVASQLPVLVGLGGAHNVTIQGLTLTDGGPDGHGVYADDAAGLVFKDNTVTNTGYGITVERSADTTVTGNHFAETGREAVYVKNGSDGATVSENLIQHASATHHGGDALWVTGSDDVTVTHNRIEDTPGKAISIGSVDGTSDAVHRAMVTYNQVVGANQETADGGGIYVISHQQDLTGDVIAYNEVTGTTALGNVTWDGKVSSGFVDPSKLVSWGIYLDDWTSGATVKGNIVHGNVGGIFLHGGWSNTVSGNILADNGGAQIGLQQSVGAGGWTGHAMTGNSISGNVIDVATGSAVHVDGSGNLAGFTANEYAHLVASGQLFDAWPQRMPSGATGTLADWQAAGYDKGALTLDPHFVDAAHGDYTLASDSPLYQHGFAHLPVDQIGLIA